MAQARLRPLLTELGWSARPGETARLRVLRAKLIGLLAVDAGDPEVLAHAARLAKDWLGTDGVLHPEALDPDLREVAMVAAARTGDAALFDLILERFRASSYPSVQGALARGLGAFLQPS